MSTFYRNNICRNCMGHNHAGYGLLLGLLSCVLTGCPSSRSESASVPKVAPDVSPTAIYSAVAGEDVNTPDRTGSEAISEGQGAPGAIGHIEDAALDGGEKLAQESLWKAASWTKRRVIALAPAGPVLIDLSVGVGGLDLQQAFADQVTGIAEELLAGLPQPVAWSTLLEQPIVKSGWLGNLVAEQDQTDQLIKMVDTSADGLVDADEMPAFLSRGLSRSDALQSTDTGMAGDFDVNASPWGPADTNRDFVLDSDELAEIVSAVARLDSSGDGAVTLQELQLASGMDMGTGSMSGGMLDTSTAIFAQAPSSAGTSQESKTPVDSRQVDREVDKDQLRQRRQQAQKILRNYTFLESIPRDQWPAWSDVQWASLDRNQDRSVDVYEIENLLELEPHAEIQIALPSSNSLTTGAAPPLGVRVNVASVDSAWHGTAFGGQLTVGNCSALISVDDAFSPQAGRLLRERLQSALRNPQIASIFAGQLQLGEGAFELIDANHDQSLDDAEFATVWKWLAVRQSARMVARWSVSSQPWFQLGDADGDRKLTAVELSRLVEKLAALDQDGDGSLTPNELPLVAELVLRRTDSRLEGNFLGPQAMTASDEIDADWFSAMDTNRDGAIHRSEFLGLQAEFSELDSDKDGFVSRREVVVAP